MPRSSLTLTPILATHTPAATRRSPSLSELEWAWVALELYACRFGTTPLVVPVNASIASEVPVRRREVPWWAADALEVAAHAQRRPVEAQQQPAYLRGEERGEHRGHVQLLRQVLGVGRELERLRDGERLEYRGVRVRHRLERGR